MSVIYEMLIRNAIGERDINQANWLSHTVDSNQLLSIATVVIIKYIPEENSHGNRHQGCV